MIKRSLRFLFFVLFLKHKKSIELVYAFIFCFFVVSLYFFLQGQDKEVMILYSKIIDPHFKDFNSDKILILRFEYVRTVCAAK